jgi:hypothetical protein
MQVKKWILATAFGFGISISMAQVKMPAPSPTQTIIQDFGIGKIELKYSRPVTKGRTVFGDLVPYNKIWRTGANGATSLKFSEPVEINGKKIDTGSYVLYTIPGIDSWEIILNKGLTNWGVDGYKESEDVTRFKVNSMKMKTPVESLTMQFSDVKPETCELHIMWEKTAVTIPISTNFKDKVKMQLEDALQNGTKKPYWAAAQFYNEYEKNPAKALENCTKALDENPTAYWIWLYKAKIQQGMGDKEGAMASAKKSLELATQDKNDDYIKMNNDLMKKLK